MATFGEVGNIKEGNAKDRTKLVEWPNGGSIATFGECGNIKESNAKDRTKPFCAVFVLFLLCICEVFLGSRTNIIPKRPLGRLGSLNKGYWKSKSAKN